jgi:hypothetical protein
MSRCVRFTNKHSASLFSMPTNKHAIVRAPSLNIYRYQFQFHPQISTVTFLFLLNPQIAEISTAGVDKVRRDLLIANINYVNLDDNVNQDNFLLTYPLHQHLFSRHTCPLHSVFLLISMDNRRTRGVNITTLPSEILHIMAAKVAKTLSTPLNDIVSLHRS